MGKSLPIQEEKKTYTAEHIGHTFFVRAVFRLVVKHQIFKRQLHMLNEPKQSNSKECKL